MIDCPIEDFLVLIGGFIIFAFLTWALVVDLGSLDRSNTDGVKNARSADTGNPEAEVVIGSNSKN